MTERLELYGAGGCPYTAELREQLEWDGSEFVEYDVEQDGAAFARLRALIGGGRTGGGGGMGSIGGMGVPVLVEDGQVRQIGWQGRTCAVSPPPGSGEY